MPLLMVDQGEKILAEAMLNKTAPQDLVLRLFKNNITPGDTDTEGAYTEADFTGYAHYDLSANGWTVTAGAPTVCAYPQVTFASTTGGQNQSIYGYYITQVSSAKLMWAERFTDAPYTIVNDGDAIKVTLNLNVKKQGE